MKLKWKCPECGSDQLSIYRTEAVVEIVEGYDEENDEIIASDSDPGNLSETLECFSCGHVVANGDDESLLDIVKELCEEDNEED